jgi:hypothetical protein
MQRAFVPVLLIALLASGCGASATTTALRAGLVSLNGARDTMRSISAAREKQIVDSCNPPSCTDAQGHAQLDAWRVTVDKLKTALDAGYQAIYGATILADAKSASDALAAIQSALALFKDFQTLTASMKLPIAPPTTPASPTPAAAAAAAPKDQKPAPAPPKEIKP